MTEDHLSKPNTLEFMREALAKHGLTPESVRDMMPRPNERVVQVGDGEGASKTPEEAFERLLRRAAKKARSLADDLDLIVG